MRQGRAFLLHVLEIRLLGQNTNGVDFFCDMVEKCWVSSYVMIFKYVGVLCLYCRVHHEQKSKTETRSG